ncbi:MAG: hypothetical protein EHM28_11565, partial [Spirochaetaceae bacterium]
MRQFLLPYEQETGKANNEQTITVSGKDFHYLVNVRRLSAGDSFTGITMTGVQYHCTITQVGRDHAIVNCMSDRGQAGGIDCDVGRDKVELVLCQCVPKLPKMDLVI